MSAVELLGVLDLDLDHPALVVAVLVDVLGRVAERIVDLDHLAGARARTGRDTALTLSTVPKTASLLELLALLGQVDLGDVAERLDGELGDADGGDVAVDARPLVLLGVAEVVRIISCSCPLSF